MRYLALTGIFAVLMAACAGMQEQNFVPVMGLKTEKKAEVKEEAIEEAIKRRASLAKSAATDSSDALSQALLFLPFRDLSKYKGPWDIYVEMPRGLADTLRGHEFFRTISVDSALIFLKDKELQGKISRDKALKVGRILGADYVIQGEIEELTIKRFRATVPIGGYRSYQGVSTVKLRPIKVIDGQPVDAVAVEVVKDSKNYGITNPAAYVPFEKEYYLLGSIPWGTEEFHHTLVGQAVGESLQKLATELSITINPPPEFSVSTPKIFAIDTVSLEAYINVGSGDGVENGAKYGVWDKGRELRDPQTNTYLGHALPRRVGVVQVKQVLNEHLSIVQILEGAEAIEKEFEVRAE